MAGVELKSLALRVPHVRRKGAAEEAEEVGLREVLVVWFEQ